MSANNLMRGALLIAVVSLAVSLALGFPLTNYGLPGNQASLELIRTTLAGGCGGGPCAAGTIHMHSDYLCPNVRPCNFPNPPIFVAINCLGNEQGGCQPACDCYGDSCTGTDETDCRIYCEPCCEVYGHCDLVGGPFCECTGGEVFLNGLKPLCTSDCDSTCCPGGDG